MNNLLLYISEEHIGEMATPLDARKVIELLQSDGWKVAYGDHPWQFEEAAQQEKFQQAFKWSLDVLEADKSYTGDGRFRELAQQRVQQNERLQPYQDHLMRHETGQGIGAG